MYVIQEEQPRSSLSGLARTPLGGRMIFVGQIRMDSKPVGKRGARVWAVNLRDHEGHRIRTYPTYPSTQTRSGGFYVVNFQFDATKIPGSVEVKVLGRKRHCLVRFRGLRPIALPRDSVRAAFDKLKASPQIRKKLTSAMKYSLRKLVGRPSPEHLLWGGLVSVDVADGRVLHCVARGGCENVYIGRRCKSRIGSSVS